MSGSADTFLERRRLRRRLTLLRLGLVIAVGFAVWGTGRHGGGIGHRAHVDELTVDGLITDEPRRTEAIDAAARDPAVRALILAVDSPGGSVAGGENLHDALARFAARKPLVAVMGGTAASAAYMISVPARRIFASEATLTGSIGVILESPDVSALLDRVGVHVDELVSGPLKGQPSVTSPLSPAGRQMLQGIVGDLYGQFVRIVATGRHMPVERVTTLADGRPYTGEQALPLGLIDQIGDRADARDWLAAHAGIPHALPLHTIDWQQHRHGFASFAGTLLGTAVGAALGAVLPPDALGRLEGAAALAGGGAFALDAGVGGAR